ALVAISAAPWHECGTSLTFALAAASKSLGGLIGGETPITTLILTVNVLLFGVSLLATGRETGALNLFGSISGRILLRMGARQSIAILQGELWRLVMTVFLHAGLLLIGMISLFFVCIGPQVEGLCAYA